MENVSRESFQELNSLDVFYVNCDEISSIMSHHNAISVIKSINGGVKVKPVVDLHVKSPCVLAEHSLAVSRSVACSIYYDDIVDTMSWHIDGNDESSHTLGERR